MFEHFTSVACEFSQPLLFTPQKSTSMEVMLIFAHCAAYTKKKSSGVDNWYLDDFFEEFICGR
jgi:hypothetical protein